MAEELRSLVKGVVADLVRKHREADFERVARLWRRVAGAKAWPHTKIVYLTKNKIRVNVDSSAWLYALNLRRERIRERLKKALDIDDIRFRLGAVDRREETVGKRDR